MKLVKGIELSMRGPQERVPTAFFLIGLETFITTAFRRNVLPLILSTSLPVMARALDLSELRYPGEDVCWNPECGIWDSRSFWKDSSISVKLCPRSDCSAAYLADLGVRLDEVVSAACARVLALEDGVESPSLR